MTGDEVRTLSDLLARMQAFHAMTLGSAAACTGKLSVQQTRSPVPYRLSLAFEQSGGAVRLRQIVEVGVLPAPGGPAVVQAIEQQIEHNLRSWRRATPTASTRWSACTPRAGCPTPCAGSFG